MKKQFWTLLALVTVAVCALAGERSAREEPSADKQLNERIAALESRVRDLEQQIAPAKKKSIPTTPGSSSRAWSEREFNGMKVFVVPCVHETEGGSRMGSSE